MAHLAFNPDGAIMRFNDIFCNAQPQTDTIQVIPDRGRPIKFTEQFGLIVFKNTRTVIHDFKCKLIVLIILSHPDTDSGLGVGKFYCVAHQIEKYLLQILCIPQNVRSFGWDLGCDLNLFDLSNRLQTLNAGFNQSIGINPFKMKFERAGLQAGRLHEMVQ